MKHERIGETWREWLISNSRGWRLLVGGICVIALAIFLHFREVRLEVLELNATASRYIVAQIDFEFPDDDTTILLKQQAMQDIGAVYQIDERQIRDARYRLGDSLISSTAWRRSAPTSTFEEMFKASDELETLLMEARFADPRTIRKIKELKIPDHSYHEFFPEQETNPMELSKEFWQRIADQMSENALFHQETIEYILHQFEEIHWLLEQDAPLERVLRAKVAQEVPVKYTRVLAGTRLIDQGERITTKHLAMMQAMKQAISESQRLNHPMNILSSLLIALIFVTISALYFRISQVRFIRSLRRISLFVCIVIITLLLAKLTEFVFLHSSSPFIGEIRYPILVPFATILICILLSPRTALFAATFLSIILSVSLAFEHSRFLVLNLVTSIVIIIYSKGIRRRKEVFGVCMKSALSAIPVVYAFSLGDNHLWCRGLVMDSLGCFMFLLITSILVIGLLPALESFFGILTDMSLVEFMDPNHELLRQFAAAVPGTYQHSLVLGNLAEIAAGAIGANGLFCRAATLYHDVGKINNPQFYTENQQTTVNMHQLLTPLESARVIISHVADGVEIAHKHRLPEPFIDIIREHHGTTLVYYFYRKAMEQGDGQVNEDDFRYPGPKPRSKESAIIMICDSIEAASRSIDHPTEESIQELVSNIVAEKAEDGQFDDCRLTFEELTKIKAALVQALLLALHVRVKYPKRPSK